MEHWSDQYIGLPYISCEQDCASLAVRVLKEQFNKDISLPASRAQGLRGQSQQIINLKDDYATPTQKPNEGDAVLIYSRGHLSHIGVYCELENTPWVLHAMKNAGSVVRHRIRELPKLGLELGGFFSWR
ncbi:MAG: C40 family peptidase [Gammaproteobacteria bacterium]|nr:C40 family peptidase [Gammaproteobacteria bacterium]